MHPYLTTTKLPAELVHEIVQFLTVPSYCRQYGYDKDVLQALSRLCLVNHFFYDVSVSYLYSSVIITNQYQLHKFVTSLDNSIVLCSYAHSLSMPNFFFDLYPSSHLTIWVCDLLNLVNPYLRRLSVCTVGWNVGHVGLKRVTFDRFTNLEEFVCMGTAGLAEVSLWPEWKNLRYLLLEGAAVEPHFINTIALMPRLTHLGLLNASWGFHLMREVEIRRIIDLSKAGRSLQKIILGFYHPLERCLLANQRAEFAKTSLNEGLDVRYVQIPITEWDSGILDNMASDGSFWELDSSSFLDETASLFEESF
ncbi:hypothetical protein L208DRAFT_89169 [Tricholoma matsutake]|nr:hypothetical protein L208DRAFT_89169 [Tricholoma matsutake 945]